MAIPTLTAEQKLCLRELQLREQRLVNQIMELSGQQRQVATEFMERAQEFARRLNVDANLFRLNVDSLVFVAGE